MAIRSGTHAAQTELQSRGFQFLRGGPQPSNTAPPPQITQTILVRQELPNHPQGQWFRVGVQGPDVRPPISDTIILRQELPDHPRSSFISGVHPFNVATHTQIKQTILVTQELPWHPRSLLIPNPPPVPIRFAGTKHFITRQELPFHPGSMFFAGNPPRGYEDRQFFIIL